MTALSKSWHGHPQFLHSGKFDKLLGMRLFNHLLVIDHYFWYWSSLLGNIRLSRRHVWITFRDCKGHMRVLSLRHCPFLYSTLLMTETRCDVLPRKSTKWKICTSCICVRSWLVELHFLTIQYNEKIQAALLTKLGTAFSMLVCLFSVDVIATEKDLMSCHANSQAVSVWKLDIWHRNCLI